MALHNPVSQTSRKRLRYSDLSLDEVRKTFDLTISRAVLFESAASIEPSQWLRQILQSGMDISVVSEKARSEFIVAPILLYIRELHQEKISIYSGVRFDVDPQRGLQGVCDFVLSKGPVLPTIQAPAFLVVEAKKNDIEEGLGQCTAEMIAARIFNERESNKILSVYGCVTTGESWQFLHLAANSLEIERNRYFIVKLPEILGVLNCIVNAVLADS